VEAKPAVPRWLPWLGLVLSLAGLGLSIYLTIAHYNEKVVLACPETGVINCAKVTTSSYSMLLGVPLPLLGLLFFVAMLVAQTPWSWRQTNRWFRRARLAFSASGIAMILYLIYVELFKLNAICLFCTGVHLLTVALFILTLIGTALTADYNQS
jgi:uncharacterized membrane protein